MEAALLKLRLNAAINAKQPIVLLLHGAHSLEIEAAEPVTNETAGPFDITGLIAIDGGEPRTGTVTVPAVSVSSMFIERGEQS